MLPFASRKARSVRGLTPVLEEYTRSVVSLVCRSRWIDLNRNMMRLCDYARLCFLLLSSRGMNVPTTPVPAPGTPAITALSRIPSTPQAPSASSSSSDFVLNLETEAGMTNIHVQNVKKVKIWWHGQPVVLD